jgi:hypothetical protein
MIAYDFHRTISRLKTKINLLTIAAHYSISK